MKANFLEFHVKIVTLLLTGTVVASYSPLPSSVYLASQSIAGGASKNLYNISLIGYSWGETLPLYTKFKKLAKLTFIARVVFTVIATSTCSFITVSKLYLNLLQLACYASSFFLRPPSYLLNLAQRHVSIVLLS